MTILESRVDEQVDYETALADPSAYYARPEDVLTDRELTLGQKQKFLTEWAQDLADRQQAAEEGMASESPADAAAEGDLLRRVRKCLEQLDGQTDSAKPEKGFWRRLFPG